MIELLTLFLLKIVVIGIGMVHRWLTTEIFETGRALRFSQPTAATVVVLSLGLSSSSCRRKKGYKPKQRPRSATWSGSSWRG